MNKTTKKGKELDKIPMPDRLYVGNYKYTVDYSDGYVTKSTNKEISELAGVVNPDQLKIQIAKFCAEQKQLLVLLHEAAHAYETDVLSLPMVDESLPESEEQELRADRMASFFIEIVLNNPHIVEKIYDVFIEE
jgi:hypothetical protein